jgi:large conductance mechanosensitive channel
VYFFVVVPINKLMASVKRVPVPPDPTTRKCQECLSEIPIQARRCRFCTSVMAS